MQTASGEKFDKSTDKIDAEAVIPKSGNGKKVNQLIDEIAVTESMGVENVENTNS